MDEVVLLNPATCGIYKDGGGRYKVDSTTGERTGELDNEMAEQVEAYLSGKPVPGMARVPLAQVYAGRILVPRYYDSRWGEPFAKLCEVEGWSAVSLGKLEDDGIIQVRGGHGSPSNDRRRGHIPYIKVSDIRSLRVNVNPTNLVSEAVARSFWRGATSGLEAWDLISPNRASSNIGEFAILLPGEEQMVLTKEVFVIRMAAGERQGWSPFFLFWALCLKAVRLQWQRVALMQTNREDVGKRYREILVPQPKSKDWAEKACGAFRQYFTTLAGARSDFCTRLRGSRLEYIASALSAVPPPVSDSSEPDDSEPG
ncbi:MAG: hypothetical protein HYZ28_13050 [Myxococcales bacterium]|nr:hypothetical protein [Myxococcales bacterium]